jgi:hypothetical protein
MVESIGLSGLRQCSLGSRSVSTAGPGWLNISTPGLDPLLAWSACVESMASVLQT